MLPGRQTPRQAGWFPLAADHILSSSPSFCRSFSVCTPDMHSWSRFFGWICLPFLPMNSARDEWPLYMWPSFSVSVIALVDLASSLALLYCYPRLYSSHRMLTSRLNIALCTNVME